MANQQSIAFSCFEISSSVYAFSLTVSSMGVGSVDVLTGIVVGSSVEGVSGACFDLPPKK